MDIVQLSGEHFFRTAIELDSDQGAPASFRILKAGDNQTKKGVVVFDEEAAKKVLAAFAEHNALLPIDYAHAMAQPTSSHRDRVAAGWFEPGVDETGALEARSVDWTPAGRQGVENKEWRYTSLYGGLERIDEKRFRLVRLFNVALTNLPATRDPMPLVASEDAPAGAEEVRMNVVLTALGVHDDDAGVAKVRALTETETKHNALVSELSELTGKSEIADIRGALQAHKSGFDRVTQLSEERDKLAARIEQGERETLIAKLGEEGKLAPAQESWAKSCPLEVLKSFAEHAPVVVPKGSVDEKPPADIVTLSDEEKHVAKLMQVDQGELLEFKREQAKKGAA